MIARPEGADRAVESANRPVLLLVAGRMVGFAASFFIPVALARVFAPADFGTYKQLFLIAGTLYGIGQFGMAESLYYFLPQGPQRSARYITNASLALLVGGLLCLAPLVLGGDTIARWLGNPALARHMPLLGLYVLLVMASAALEIVMIARKRYGWAAASYATLDLLRAALLVIPALLVRDLEWLLVGAVGFALVRCALTLWYLVWNVGAGLRPDAMLLRRQLAYAIPFYLSGLVELVQSNLHQYVVAYRFDAATFAIYSVGCLQIPLVELVFASMATVMMVRMGEALRDGRDWAAREIWHDTSRKLALLLFPLAGLLVVIARPLIVFLFTDTYAASAPVFMVWSLALLWPALAVDGVLRVYAETRFLFALNAARLVITVALIGALIGSFGLIGAILSTLVAAVVSRVLGLARIGMLMKIKTVELLPWRDLGTILGAAGLAAGSVVVADLALDLSPMLSVLVGSLLYGVVYLAAVWRFGALRDDERSALTAQLARWGVVFTGGVAAGSERSDSCVEPEK